MLVDQRPKRRLRSERGGQAVSQWCMAIRHVGQRETGGVFPICAGDECQAAENNDGKQHGRSAVATSPRTGMG